MKILWKMELGHVHVFFALIFRCQAFPAAMVGQAVSMLGGSGGNGSNGDVLGTVNQVIDLAAKIGDMSQKQFDKRYEAVAQKPQDLISEGAMSEALKAVSSGAGSKEIQFQPMPGFDGQDTYQGGGWKLGAKPMPPEKKEKVSKDGAVEYPGGVGRAIVNGCFLQNYAKGDPCYDAVRMTTVCVDVVDGINFIGVGFNGRGFYSSDSRRQSIIQRMCAQKKFYHGKAYPDTMTVFGIYDYSVKTSTYSSADEYIESLQEMAATTKTSKMFHDEKTSKETVHAEGVGDIFGLVDVGSAHSRGSSSSNQRGKGQASLAKSRQMKNKKKKTNNFIAVCEANLKLFEIALDVVTGKDLSLPFLKDFDDLPDAWQSVGAMDKYQAFVLRYGTHYVTSSKFGGQMKITKTSSADSTMTQEQFSEQASSDLSDMFATTKNAYEQKESHFKWGASGFKDTEKSQVAKGTAGSEAMSNTKGSQTGSGLKSETTSMKTSLEVKGGSVQLAKAVMDYYSPSFRADFAEWLDSIHEFPKPFEFTLRKVSDIFDMNPEDLFNPNRTSNESRGCLGGVKSFRQKDKTTLCKYHSEEDLIESFKEKRLSLQRAEAIYMAEGPFDTSSFEVKGGNMGCETNYYDYADEEKPKTWPKWRDMIDKSELFKIEFKLPYDLSFLDSDDELIMRLSGHDEEGEMWMYKFPGDSFRINNACPRKRGHEYIICVADLEMRYDQETGFLRFNADLSSKQSNMTSEMASFGKEMPIGMVTFQDRDENPVLDELFKVPCSVQWTNSHRIDPSNENNCVYFTASTTGSIYLVFSEIPADKKTWYYLHISPSGVYFYQQMKLVQYSRHKGDGSLGNQNLYESYFVCVTQDAQSFIKFLYGKTSARRGKGLVKAAFTFEDSLGEHLTFFSFGTGHADLKIDDVRIVSDLPDNVDCPNGYIRAENDRTCDLECHPECKMCREANNAKKCLGCRNYEDILPGGEINCVSKCPAGKEVGAEDRCSKCREGFVSGNASNSCQKCKRGQYQDERGAENCKPCPLGSYSDVDGAIECQLCAFGYHNNQTEQSSCPKCPGHVTLHIKGAVNCDNTCKKGTYWHETYCNDAPIGHMVDKPTMTTPTKCPKGTFQDERGKHRCKPCDKGKYASEEGSTACKSCPKGEYQDEGGMEMCKKCGDGEISFGEGNKECFKKCEKGWFHPEYFREDCRVCPRGTFSTKRGSEACQRCGKGRMQLRRGRDSCSQVATFRLYGPDADSMIPKGFLEVKNDRMWGTVCDQSKSTSNATQAHASSHGASTAVFQGNSIPEGWTTKDFPEMQKQAVVHTLADRQSDDMSNTIALVVCGMMGYDLGVAIKPSEVTFPGQKKKSSRHAVWKEVNCDEKENDLFRCDYKECYPHCDPKCPKLAIKCSDFAGGW